MQFRYLFWSSLSPVIALAGCSGNPGATTSETTEQAQAAVQGESPFAAETPVVAWNEAALAAIQASGYGAPIAARALAEVFTATFDAWAAYTATATPETAGAPARQPARERTRKNKTLALSYAAYRVLTDLFPTSEPLFHQRLREFGGDPSNTTTDQTTAAGVGNVAGAAVIAFRHEDASNQLGDIQPPPYSDYTGYAPVNTPTTVNDPNRWQPLLVGGQEQTFVTPQCGVRPCVRAD